MAVVDVKDLCIVIQASLQLSVSVGVCVCVQLCVLFMYTYRCVYESMRLTIQILY